MRNINQSLCIGVMCNRRDGRTRSFQSANHFYLTAISDYMNAIALLIPAAVDAHHAFEAEAIIERIDGLLLTGNRTNIHPSHYDEAVQAHHEPFDDERDRASFALIKAAMERDLPMLGVCRGHQEINVALGGSLRAQTHLAPEASAHQLGDTVPPETSFAARHQINFTENGYLHKLIGRPHAQVNSLHSQVIDRLGDGLVVEALADDGIIEAVRQPSYAYCLGVQWHPEYQTGENYISEKLFADFANHATAYANA